MILAKKCALMLVASAFLVGTLAGCGEKTTEKTSTTEVKKTEEKPK
jgi:hypothetical protein